MTELKPLIDYVPEPQRSFLSQPLTLGMFVPCDDGNVIHEPNRDAFNLLNPKMEKVYKDLKTQHKSALDRVIFDGFEVTGNIGDAVLVSSDNIGIDFYQNGQVIMWKMHEGDWNFTEEVKTISDLCGYGIKLKHR